MRVNKLFLQKNKSKVEHKESTNRCDAFADVTGTENKVQEEI